MVKTHPWKTPHQIAVKFLIKLDPEILDPGRHPFP
jgi:hypothetical protein